MHRGQWSVVVGFAGWLVVNFLISCGTNHQGLGPVQDGERVEIEVEGVGRMAVKVQDPLKRSWPKEIDEDMARFVREWRQNPSTPPPRAMTPRR